MSNVTTDQEKIREQVREGYGQIAEESGSSCCGPKTACCGGVRTPDALAAKLGYDEAELAVLPEGANLGLSCGNPTAMATLKEGEVVVDLGSGGGFDVFIAGRKVGAAGRAIGVDMTPEMIAKARKNMASYHDATGLDNVEFRLGEIEHLPVADNSTDAIISNCVINLSPDKAQVWRDMFRVLKPGGRVAVSDIALLKPLPEAVMELVDSRVGCLSGAVLREETARMVEAAGFVDVEFASSTVYIDALIDGNDPLYQGVLEFLPESVKVSDYVTSLGVTARKPA